MEWEDWIRKPLIGLGCKQQESSFRKIRKSVSTSVDEHELQYKGDLRETDLYYLILQENLLSIITSVIIKMFVTVLQSDTGGQV